jgi:hypothetical protein
VNHLDLLDEMWTELGRSRPDRKVFVRCVGKLREMDLIRLTPGQVVAEWVSCPCCAPPEKLCAFCMGVNKILVEEGK